MKKVISIIQVVFLFLTLTDVYSQWYPQTSGTTDRLFSVHFPTLNNGYVVGDEGTILKTINGGINWTSQSSGTAYSLTDVCFVDANTGFVVGVATIIRTTNGGINWTIQSIGTSYVLESVSFTDANNGTAVGQGGTILRTINGGINWTSQSSGTYNTLWSASFIDANNGTVVGYYGTILRTTNGGVFVNQVSSKIPERFSLYQNYPNPFNLSTNIRFDILKSSYIKLTIYDILGKEVSVFINENLTAGIYEVSWDGSVYPTGVYFYRLVTGNFVNVKKMVLIK